MPDLHERFADIQNRLAKDGMRTGFACLFSGSPGTGKTETAYRLPVCAKETSYKKRHTYTD